MGYLHSLINVREIKRRNANLGVLWLKNRRLKLFSCRGLKFKRLILGVELQDKSCVN